jgi:hypothetical protein
VLQRLPRVNRLLSMAFVRSFPIRRSIEDSPKSSFPAPDTGNEKFNCRPVLSAQLVRSCSAQSGNLSRGFCTSVLAAFNRLIATGYTTATIANCKIGGDLRHFASLWAPRLETTLQAPACSATNESSQPAFQTRLTAAKPRQRPSSTATQKMAQNGTFSKAKVPNHRPLM